MLLIVASLFVTLDSIGHLLARHGLPYINQLQGRVLIGEPSSSTVYMQPLLIVYPV